MLNQQQTNWGIINLPNKKAPSGAFFCLNGASNGRELENICISVAQQTLHEIELMMNIKVWLCSWYNQGVSRFI